MEVLTSAQALAPVPATCNNWLQSGCPLNNNMVIHHCDSAGTEDIGKQDQIRGMALLHFCTASLMNISSCSSLQEVAPLVLNSNFLALTLEKFKD